MTAAVLHTAREPAVLVLGRLLAVPQASGALWLPEVATLLVADLHLEKGSCYAGRGVLLPPYDSRTTLAALALAVAALNPRTVIALGDSFHDAGGGDRLDEVDLKALAALQAGRSWLWLSGNHDPSIPPRIGGDRAEELHLDGVAMRHAPKPGETAPEIAGHLHPTAKVRLRGRGVRRRCFAAASNRIVMPAFGAYAGGLNLRDEAFSGLFREEPMAHMLGGARVFSIGWPLLLPD